MTSCALWPPVTWTRGLAHVTSCRLLSFVQPNAKPRRVACFASGFARHPIVDGHAYWQRLRELRRQQVEAWKAAHPRRPSLTWPLIESVADVPVAYVGSNGLRRRDIGVAGGGVPLLALRDTAAV